MRQLRPHRGRNRENVWSSQLDFKLKAEAAEVLSELTVSLLAPGPELQWG